MQFRLCFKKEEYDMSDSTMDDIKSGKGLPPLPNDTNISNDGTTTEQRDSNGVTYEIFTQNIDSEGKEK